jgi:hypothetical protein
MFDLSLQGRVLGCSTGAGDRVAAMPRGAEFWQLELLLAFLTCPYWIARGSTHEGTGFTSRFR